MAPSPRKSAPSTFHQTWEDADAALLDPHSLPVSKVPRAWERRPETKISGNGRQKKVWRRYTLRSQGANTTSPDEDEEEAHDSRSRPVKRLQRMSPDAIAKTTAMFNGKKRGFKAMRWDRRKSVLPRKKRTIVESSLSDAEETNSAGDDTADADVSNSSLSEIEVTRHEDVVSKTMLVQESDDRRSTFTFAVEGSPIKYTPSKPSDSPTALDDSIRASPESSAEQDATLVQLFRTPTKIAISIETQRSTEHVEYPQLPHSEDIETAPTTASEFMDVEEVDAALGTLEEDVSIRKGPMARELRNEDAVIEEIFFQEPEGTEQVEKEDVTDAAEAAEAGISYPSLPAEVSSTASVGSPTQNMDGEAETSEITMDVSSTQKQNALDNIESEATVDSLLGEPQEDVSTEEQFTEASLQLDIQRDMEHAMQEEPKGSVTSEEQQSTFGNDGIVNGFADDMTQPLGLEKANIDVQATSILPADQATERPIIDIADGLTLASSKPSSTEHTARKLRSPSPPPVESGPDDVTMTMPLDDDTGFLKDFLDRAAASKAAKAANIARRESLQNRRDSDVVRHALASPRKVLEAKDPNSPSKYDNEATLDLSQTLTLNMDQQPPLSPSQEQADTESTADSKSSRTSRRSSRTRKSRLPAPSSAPQQTQTPKIAVRRADGGEHIVLKKTDAQELSLLTRSNTRKNKLGAVAVNVRLMKLATEAASRLSEDSTSSYVGGPVPGKKAVHWDEQLAYYQEGTETIANMLAEAESLASPDELSLPVSASSSKPKSRTSTEKNSTPKIRRVRGLGTANGTPGKGLLAAASLLPDAVQEERDAAQVQRLPKPRSSKVKKMPIASTSNEQTLSSTPLDTKLPTLDVAPVGISPVKDAKAAKERKSRLATPKKVKFPQPTSTVPMEGKENQQRTGTGGANPKGIVMPQVNVPPTTGVETGLPRRRGRKL